MPRYFFHVREGRDIPDRDGIELPGLAEVRAQAVVAAAETLKDLDGKFWRTPDWRMWVTDETGETVCSLRVCGE